MTVYSIAALKFTDRNAYNRYQAAFMEVFQRHSGRCWQPTKRHRS